MGRRSKGAANAEEEAAVGATQMPKSGKRRTSTRAKKEREAAGPSSSVSAKVAEEREMRRRRKRMRGMPVDCCDTNVDAAATAKIFKQVKYYFNNMNMAQTLIDAYAHEGWKGQSREKVRPEKELEKATAKIVRWKNKIREAIKELDEMCAAGSIRDSAFDADGQLDYAEIFCAKCHSPEAEVDDDIILCDGFCNRGFHQKCLNPPLATEDIPPGDEGWMCPVCDCKTDCLNFLNERLNTDFEVETSWENIFPEAVQGSASVADGAIPEFPSDDEDDDDYDPEKKDKEQEELANGAAAKEEQDEAGEDEDGDDSGAESDGGGGGGGGDSESDGGTTDLSGEEPLSGAENDDDDEVAKEKPEDADGEVPGKRRRRDVDYRKLHDEMFGVEYEFEEAFQSEDEDYGPLKKQRKQRGERKGDRNQNDIKSRRMPAEAVQRLREVFDRDQLPSRSRKEVLAQELGLSYRKVDTWFKNVRTQALRKAKSDAAENEMLLMQVGQVQLKLYDMKKTMEAVRHLDLLKLSQGFLENSVVDVNRGKRLVYIPYVTEVVEKTSLA